eukprot:g27763.t1
MLRGNPAPSTNRLHHGVLLPNQPQIDPELARRSNCWELHAPETMGLCRKIVQSKASLRSYHFGLLFVAALAVFAFYYLGSNHENFSSTTRRMKENQAGKSSQGDVQLTANLSGKKAAESQGSLPFANSEPEDTAGKRTVLFHALMMFTKVDKNYGLQEKFTVAIKSMVKHAVFKDDEVLCLHFVADVPSKKIGEPLLQQLLQIASFKYQ